MHAQARFHDDYLRRFGPMAAGRMGPGGHARGSNMEGFDYDSWFAAQEQAAQAAQASFARSSERAREHVRRQSASAPRRPPSYNAPPFIFPGRSPYVDDWEPPLGTLDTPFGRRANLDELDVFNPRTLEDMDLEYTAVQIQHEMDRRRRVRQHQRQNGGNAHSPMPKPPPPFFDQHPSLSRSRSTQYMARQARPSPPGAARPVPAPAPAPAPFVYSTYPQSRGGINPGPSRFPIQHSPTREFLWR